MARNVLITIRIHRLKLTLGMTATLAEHAHHSKHMIYTALHGYTVQAP